jgi:prepilin-type processing-associated H-X9-DG protein
VGFERSAGGYGYNNAYLGSSTGDPHLASLSLPIAEYERRVVNVPAKLAQIRRASEKIAFADTALAAPTLIEYSFVEAPLSATGHPQAPSIHFRHRGGANIAWADGHVTRQRMDWTYPTNVYGADNARFHLGFFGPTDNTLFARP